MDILDVCITGIVSEEELNRVVRVTIDTDFQTTGTIKSAAPLL